jgi:hypothetical protein
MRRQVGCCAWKPRCMPRKAMARASPSRRRTCSLQLNPRGPPADIAIPHHQRPATGGRPPGQAGRTVPTRCSCGFFVGILVRETAVLAITFALFLRFLQVRGLADCPEKWWSGAGSNRRPSAFQAGHIPSWHGSCERYALSLVAAGSWWLLPLLSSLLSAARGTHYERVPVCWPRVRSPRWPHVHELLLVVAVGC